MKKMYITPLFDEVCFHEEVSILAGSDNKLSYIYGQYERGEGDAENGGTFETSAKESWDCWADDDEDNF